MTSPAPSHTVRHSSHLDLLRILLCAAVVYYHYMNPRPAVGTFAVIGFFVLAGFLSAYTLGGKELDISSFFSNKARRFLPTLFSTTVLAVGLVVSLFFLNPQFPTWQHGAGALKNFLVAKHFSLASFIEAINTPAWYIRCELLYIALLPFFLAAFKSKIAFRLLFAVFFSAALIQFSQIEWCTPFGGGLHFSISCRVWQFLAGMGACALTRVAFPHWFRIFIIGVAAALFLVLTCLSQDTIHFINFTLPHDIVITGLFVLLIPMLLQMDVERPSAGSTPWRKQLMWGASLTFGVYLIHSPVFLFLEAIHPEPILFSLENQVFALIITLGLAWLNLIWWENRWVAHRRPQKTPDSPAGQPDQDSVEGGYSPAG